MFRLDKITRCGLKHLNKLDAAEERERLEKERVEVREFPEPINPEVSFDPHVFSGFGLEALFWSGPLFNGGTFVIDSVLLVSFLWVPRYRLV